MSIESYDENQEQIPKLTENQKEEMYLKCKQEVEDAMGHISTLYSKNMSEAKKLSAAEDFKELFNEGAFIVIGHDSMPIDDFCNRAIKGEIELTYLQLMQMNTSTKFRQGQFIKRSSPNDIHGNMHTRRLRKIDSLSFRPRIEGVQRTDKFYGLDDIKPKSIKEKEQQKFQNSMGKSTAMYDDHEESRKNDEKDAETILNSIT